jgi:hypothetical protein
LQHAWHNISRINQNILIMINPQLNEPQNNITGPDSYYSEDKSDPGALHVGDSSLQTPEEFEKDKKGDHTKEDNTVASSGTDDLQTNSDGAAGTDRAGTTERKPYGDVELNKGLESQAKDGESI